SAGGGIGLSALAARLAGLGYTRTPLVEQEGDYSVRGGIIDAWSPGDEMPVRAEFFGDELESLRTFNPATQLSVGAIDACELLPAAERGGGDDAAGQQPTLLGLMPQGSALLALEHNEYDVAALLSSEAFSTRVFTGDPAPRGVPSGDFQTSPLPGFAELGAEEAHHPELFDAARRRLEQHVEAARRRGSLVLHADGLSGGFEAGGLVVVTKADRVFTRRKVHARSGRQVSRGARLSDFDDIEPGEYVVHVDHGVGRYVGSSEILVDGVRSEVFSIEYADGGMLHVPSAHAHLLSRYVGVHGEEVRLHSLDGRRWAKDKLNAQRAVSDLASALLETQARRETAPGFAYDVECDGIEAFEAAFPYEETPDQAAAVEAVKRDLAARKPMDRLICGDAGYGKTEVAMRAAFIAAMNGRQVAVLAPTTVLAEQHFETFASRFDGTPVRIESVSRFQSRGAHEGTFRRLATGVCDVVIGTHAILSDRICFRDLGLIIIDEEQRFGVKHKEFLKRLKATADVLTLSATPIPRTLYLSMTGARDLSLLRSPPRERVAVETRVVRDSDETVRAAVEAELRRGGQVYFLHNRVFTIGKAERRLRALCPKARVVVAHGQMDARTLAKKMRDFERGAYDVLLSTTIIESGIDIPRANTILVDQAETFGMADLYQLRGRVGRSARRGYAYFLLPASGSVDSEARERLAALKRHGGLGGGFNLAVRDLELRGAGNLLGSQQSGHIAAVGFGLYCQLLQRTIARLKGEKVRDVVDVRLNLDFTNPRLPCDYIEEDVQRLSLMKRFAEAQDMRVVRALADEMRDRFGAPPPEALEFVSIASLRIACAAAGMDRIDMTGNRAFCYKTGERNVSLVVDLKSNTSQGRISELLRRITAQKARKGR
ncbi:MAG: transcription-repair coupling factor, partial [Kiritimatiellae bacterium]|nr:transcription-repair coupling factor [Kiritimatiellia bacterium]